MSEWSGLVGNSQSIQWAYWLEVSSNGRFWSGVLSWCNTSLVKTCLLLWFGYCCQKAEKTCSWELGWKLFSGRLTREMLHHDAGLGAAFEIQSTGKMWLRELTAHSPPCIQVIPTTRKYPTSPVCLYAFCSFYVSVLGPNFPFPIVTPDTSHSGSGHTHPIDFILHLRGPYFQIESHQEELGVRISPREFGWLQRHRVSCHREVEGSENGGRT